jgi:hypothetical protein
MIFIGPSFSWLSPKIVHTFIRRDAAGHRTVDTWNALGLRAARCESRVEDATHEVIGQAWLGLLGKV